MGERRTIYVPLVNEGTAVWRPVEAEQIAPHLYRLAGLVPDGESWAFQPGEVVRCREQVFSSGDRGLAAVERGRV